MMFDSLREQLFKPNAGEIRLQGLLEKVECDNRGQYFVFRTERETLKLRVNQGLKIRMFVPIWRVCNFSAEQKEEMSLRSSSTRQRKIKRQKLQVVVSLEFVPKNFTLSNTKYSILIRIY